MTGGTFWTALAVATLLRVVAAAVVPLTLTEPYYLLWSRHLALGYYDHPPLIAWVSAPFSFLGGSPLVARLPALLSSVGVVLLMRRYARLMFNDERTANATGILALLVPYLSVEALLLTPECMLLLCWAWVLVAWHEALFEERGSYLVAGIALGAALLAKFTAFGLVAGLLMLFLVSPVARWSWQVLLMTFAVAYAVYSPFLMWNAAHGWETFAFQLGGRRGGDGGFHLWSFLGETAAGIGPVLFLAIPVGVVWALRRRDATVPLAVCLSLPVLLGFALLSLRMKVQAYWVLAGVLGTLPLVAGWYVQQLPRRRWVGWLTVATGALPLLLALVLALYPSALFRLFKPGGLTELYGMPSLARLMENGRQEMPRPEQTVLAAEDHRLASHLTLLTSGAVLVLGGDVRGLEYLRWQDLSRHRGDDVLLVHRHPLAADAHVRQAFERLEETGLHDVTYGPWVAQRFYLTRGYGFRPGVWSKPEE